jgi:hypothetical protein
MLHAIIDQDQVDTQNEVVKEEKETELTILLMQNLDIEKLINICLQIIPMVNLLLVHLKT